MAIRCALVKHLSGISDAGITGLEIPTASRSSMNWTTTWPKWNASLSER
jgi:bisphosphoglycerate-dependent phosphoglycerate mutase